MAILASMCRVRAVVKGLTRPIDVVSVLQPPGRRYYSIVSINFGLITNLDIGTEHMRCIAVVSCSLPRCSRQRPGAKRSFALQASQAQCPL